MSSKTSMKSLNFAVIVSPPSVSRCFLNGTVCPKPGVSIEMTKLACAALKYNCTFTWAGTDAFGYLENGTWRGVIGYIKDGIFDAGLPRFAPTADRWSAVDFSEGFFFDSKLLITRHPTSTAGTASLDLLGGFRWHVWLCITAVMFLAVNLMEDTLIIRRKKAVVDEMLERHVSKLLRECKRFRIALMSLAALILLRSYTGYIFSQGVVLYPDPPFTDLQTFVECIEAGKCKLATISPTVGYLKDVLNSNDGELYRRLRTALTKRPLHVAMTMEEMLTEIQNDNSTYVVGFASDLDFYYVARHEHCKFYKLGTVFASTPNTIPIPKKSPLRTDFDRVARAFRESGIAKKLLADYYRVDDDTCPKPKHGLQAASVRFLVDVFVFFGAGALLSLLAFGVELALAWIKVKMDIWKHRMS